MTFTAKGADDVPLVVRVAGAGVHVDATGAPVQVNVIVPLKPVGLICRLYVAGWPAVTVALVELPVGVTMEKSVPIPESETVCGLPEELSAMERVPVRLPVAVGVKVIVI